MPEGRHAGNHRDIAVPAMRMYGGIAAKAAARGSRAAAVAVAAAASWAAPRIWRAICRLARWAAPRIRDAACRFALWAWPRIRVRMTMRGITGAIQLLAFPLSVVVLGDGDLSGPGTWMLAFTIIFAANAANWGAKAWGQRRWRKRQIAQTSVAVTDHEARIKANEAQIANLMTVIAAMYRYAGYDVPDDLEATRPDLYLVRNGA